MTLRPLSKGDHALTLSWRNREDVRNGMFNTDLIPAENHAKWIDSVIANPAKDYSIYSEDSRPLGVVGVIFRDVNTGEAEWSFHIGADDAPRGAGGRMLREALARFFTELGGAVMYAEVLEDNHASLRVHKKLGFDAMGALDHRVTHNDKEKSVFLFSVRRDAWQRTENPDL